MVKLYSLAILYKGPNDAERFKASYELQSFGYFQRNSAQEFMTFVAKTIVERTQPCSRQSIKEGDYMCHVYVRGDNLAGVVVCDQEYPSRVAHTLITKVLDEFAAKVPASSWPGLKEKDITFNELDLHLIKYQNPREADAMTKMQDDLDETKIIMHQTITAVLQRGEKIEDLVTKSEVLGTHSKMFYQTARKTNSCCNFG